VKEKRMMADNVIFFIDDAIKKSTCKTIKMLVFQNSPMSFTSLRIVNSLAKGFSIAKQDIKLTAVSSFLTYFLKASTKSPNGLICIPTMRGDYFTCKYEKLMLGQIEIRDICHIKAEVSQVFFEDDLFFKDINFANAQIEALKLESANASKFIIHGMPEVNYGYTPKYNY
jgi:tRNA A37 threonylcarbamoyladenosine modification protein TsaB